MKKQIPFTAIFVWLILLGQALTPATASDEGPTSPDWTMSSIKGSNIRLAAPSVPENLRVTQISGVQVDLAWDASTGTTGVAGYYVYRDGIQIGETSFTVYNDTTGDPATSYVYTVAAYDPALDMSEQSAPLSATTGQVYYVSPSGNDENDGRTIETPWLTWRKAVSEPFAGDVVYLTGGTYTITNTNNDFPETSHAGTITAPITIKAYECQIPIITGDGFHSLLHIDHPYWIIDGISFVGSNLPDHDSDLIHIGGRQEAYHVTVQNSSFTILSAAGHDNISCIHVHGGYGHYALIRNNRFEGRNPIPGTDYDGVQYLSLGNVGTKVLNNEFYNLDTGVYVKHANTGDTATSGAEVAYNYIYNCRVGLNGGAPTYVDYHDNIIYGGGIDFGLTGGGAQGHHNTIRHNTVYSSGLTFQHSEAGIITNSVIGDNIFMDTVALVRWSISPIVPHNTTSDYNLYIPGESALIEYGVRYSLETWQDHYDGDVHSTTGTPIFVGGNNPAIITDFELTTASPGKSAASDGRDMGADISLVGIQPFCSSPHANTFVYLPIVQKETIVAADSCEYNDVSTAVANAKPNDTIIVPAGTCTWTTSLLLNKAIRLVGAGMDATILINGIQNTGLGDFLIKITPENPADNPFIEVTGFTFDANYEGSCISISSHDDVHPFRNFRIHHNRIKNTLDEVDDEAYMAVRVKGNCFGLIDNNLFENNWEDLKIYGNDSNSWEQFLGVNNIGTENYVYIEDNTFTRQYNNEFVLSSGEGARWVFRYNTIDGQLMLDAHGDTRNRGVVAHEVYENVATNDADPVTGGGFKHDYRGGTGIIFNNNVQMGTSGVRGLYQVREEHESCTNSSGCDGSPGGDQVNNGYIWNNRNTRDNQIIAVWHDEFDPYDHIAEDTDWWDDASRSPGGESPTNFLYGPAASRPQESKNNDCYWEADTRMLYRSIGDNNWTFIYKPFTYPHPLRTMDSKY